MRHGLMAPFYALRLICCIVKAQSKAVVRAIFSIAYCGGLTRLRGGAVETWLCLPT
jgi:hypothetical protein